MPSVLVVYSVWMLGFSHWLLHLNTLTTRKYQLAYTIYPSVSKNGHKVTVLIPCWVVSIHLKLGVSLTPQALSPNLMLIELHVIIDELHARMMKQDIIKSTHMCTKFKSFAKISTQWNIYIMIVWIKHSFNSKSVPFFNGS